MSCHNVANQTEFYMGQTRFNVTFIGNAGCFKKSFIAYKLSVVQQPAFKGRAKIRLALAL
jgi:hypothetical protein